MSKCKACNQLLSSLDLIIDDRAELCERCMDSIGFVPKSITTISKDNLLELDKDDEI